MIRRALALLVMIVGTAGLHTVVAPAASAAVQRPVSGYVADGVTLSGYLYVDTANGKASGHLLWSPAATGGDAYFRVVTTLYRDGVPTTKDCGQVFIPANSSGSSPECNVYVPNPAGTNRWKASIKVLVGLSSNPPVKGPFVSEDIVA